MTKRIAILGSTGSIGQQTLAVVDQNPQQLQVIALAAGTNWRKMLDQVRRYQPEMVAMTDMAAAEQLAAALNRERLSVPVMAGEEGLNRVATHPVADTVVTAVSGAVGLGPTLAAIAAGKNIALANKETLVAAGSLVMAAVKQQGVALLPVDSEHSALFQCLQGQECDDVRLILTASGGPFREWSAAKIDEVTPEAALSHPNWRMGPKITIDSATLMNKGLEVIEAYWLFGVEFDRISVLIHPQSIVHSLVEFADGSVMAQMGVPDMCLPIQYALSYPKRWPASRPRLDLAGLSQLTFSLPDLQRFPCLALALAAGKAGGSLPAVMNAANEVAVAAFLARRIGFTAIPRVVKETMDTHAWCADPDLTAIRCADHWAREQAERRIREVTA
ncbi:MAG: 1-deoxy-D-xylulose-5-phosphate reductoisomerase [Heliobacteriaceae bacterium]|nr:1-deoxy-D-xylulose-5-phosphate reductoisomerase [Heliobacteriaceae bacterium]MDD4587244.1 1-deoxy-D-xylulose-5-phosphate reductoisomerase [Heliobacteriaceae bacterium]